MFYLHRAGVQVVVFKGCAESYAAAIMFKLSAATRREAAAIATNRNLI